MSKLYKRWGIVILLLSSVAAFLLFQQRDQTSNELLESTERPIQDDVPPINLVEAHDTQPSFYLNEHVQLRFANPHLTLVRDIVEEKQYATDQLFTYEYTDEENNVLATLDITIRTIHNGDRLLFTQLYRESDEPIDMPFTLSMPSQHEVDFFQIAEPIEQEHDRVYGIDYTTNVKGLYTIDEQQLLVSQNYISTPLTETYEDGSVSTLRELVSEDDFVELTQSEDNVTFHFKLRTTDAEQMSERWFLFSEQHLVGTEKSIEHYKQNTNEKFISSPKWMIPEGNLTKLPWSVEPSTKLAYGENLNAIHGKLFLQMLEYHPDDRLYYDLFIHSLNAILDYNKDEDSPLWKTKYTSTWLKRDYGIRAPYIDTRHNENVALFLTRAGEYLEDERLQTEPLQNYANFLVMQEEIGNILPSGEGYYILDYYAETQTKKTHVSLNHVLGELVFLLKTYDSTEDERYLQTALQIKRAVEATGLDWINPENGDLWYQINGDYSFHGKDYTFLTLTDLLVTVEQYEALQIEYPTELYETLIQSKLEFLEREGEALPQHVQQLLETSSLFSS